ncbi:HesA/MoeB/ThiF family protein [Sphingomonas jeddahensis]|uniref:Putative adenylyltransferase/sulfurtransferase MoeZ n=1 Tax=Sphingomonas jeddahensis TaxID=1915074 RepID=A0A1V2EXY3_9SPHN|nr:HesA/MoeB/ThiF family protein [Sphingomonas jeddahensis]ONF97049.1 putative adenylyltransferase/sulfurtransferase MoeZ [Sphingomonas jeddahensis]
MAVTLSEEERARYARQIILKEIGGAGQRRIKRATVAMIGAGGIGSPAAAYLAGAGVGRLVIIDDDRVDTSNLQRQILFDTADVGGSKAQRAAEAVRRRNPHVDVVALDDRITVANAATLLAGADVVLDGCDNFATRLIVADAALALRLPLVSAAVGQFEGQLATYRGWESDKPCYRCLVGAAPDRDEGTCAEQGILGPVTGILGSMAALEAIRAVTPFGEDSAGRLTLVDLLDLRFRTIRVAKDPACPGCRAASAQ